MNVRSRIVVAAGVTAMLASMVACASGSTVTRMPAGSGEVASPTIGTLPQVSAGAATPTRADAGSDAGGEPGGDSTAVRR